MTLQIVSRFRSLKNFLKIQCPFVQLWNILVSFFILLRKLMKTRKLEHNENNQLQIQSFKIKRAFFSKSILLNNLVGQSYWTSFISSQIRNCAKVFNRLKCHFNLQCNFSAQNIVKNVGEIFGFGVGWLRGLSRCWRSTLP